MSSSTYQQEFVLVRSIDRVLGTANSFNVALPKTFNKVVGVALLSAEVPYSFYNISPSYASNVRFTQSLPTTIVADYAVNPAFFTITSLQADLLAFLQANFPALSISAVNYSELTGKLTIVIGDLTGVLSVAKGPGVVPALCNVLGVDPLNATASIAAGGTNTLALPMVANLAPQTDLLVKLQNVGTNVSSTSGVAAMFRIQISSTPGSILFVNNANNVGNTVALVTPIQSLSTLVIQLGFGDGTLVNLNGCEWCMGIQITYLI